ncbi:MAG: ABC transporter substrate-binding protein [Actinomycetota bacterium]|nr:ABC transporter substrate-binding protein [Actinomycetota bacterium]
MCGGMWLLLAITVSVSALGGCTPDRFQGVVDDAGRRVEIPSAPQRIIALDSSSIEILFGLGLGDRVVGRPEHLEFPPEALKVADVGDINNPDIEKMVGLKPDFVMITSSEGFRDWVPQAEESGLKVLTFDYPSDLHEVFEHIKQVGKMVGSGDAAVTLASDLQHQADVVASRVEGLSEGEKPRVLVITYFGAKLGTYGDRSREGDLVRLTGGRKVLADRLPASEGKSAYFGYVSPEAVVEQNPQVVVVLYSKQGEDDKKAATAAIEQVVSTAGWGELDAVKNRHIYAIDQQLTWANPRIVQGLEAFSSVIQKTDRVRTTNHNEQTSGSPRP